MCLQIQVNNFKPILEKNFMEETKTPPNLRKIIKSLMNSNSKRDKIASANLFS